ncbi:hypothetical protein HNQ71_004060 [Mesorhizobium sangaii]|uniref:Uncharacterized protein n=1 Tax=Mesorhizobium sangaii TaxID=505389 RepID=A0A841P8B2_9HYPH|nr:hypothetical protein [Mesorhizobium sangaii]
MACQQARATKTGGFPGLFSVFVARDAALREARASLDQPASTALLVVFPPDFFWGLLFGESIATKRTPA